MTHETLDRLKPAVVIFGRGASAARDPTPEALRGTTDAVASPTLCGVVGPDGHHRRVALRVREAPRLLGVDLEQHGVLVHIASLRRIDEAGAARRVEDQ